jgi:hypothetical protein
MQNINYSINGHKYRSYYLIIFQIIFVFFSVSPNFALSEVDDRNYVLIGLMVSIQIFAPFIRKVTFNEVLLIIFVILLLFGAFINNNTRWNSIFYQLAFISTFIISFRMFKLSNISPIQILRLIKGIIYLYFLVLVIQQIALIFDFTPPMAGNYDPSNPWKLSSLAAEPSISALNVGILGYIYLEILRLLNIKIRGQYIFVVGSVFWILLTSLSSTGIIFSLFLIARLYTSHKPLIVALLIASMPLAIIEIDVQSINRALVFAQALISLDPVQIIQADHSASYRVLPFFLLLNTFDPLSMSGLLGYGNSFVQQYLYTVMPGTPEGHVAGGLAVMLVEHGWMTLIPFVIFVFRTCCRKSSVFDLLCVLYVFTAINGVNNQAFWFVIMAMSTNKYLFAKGR